MNKSQKHKAKWGKQIEKESCVSVVPLKCRHQDRIRHARHLLVETPVKEKGGGAGEVGASFQMVMQA